jgi:hypothetical protein
VRDFEQYFVLVWYGDGNLFKAEQADSPELQRFHLLQFGSFINEHNGNVVFNVVEKFAGITDEPVLGFIEINISLALWTCKNIQ